MAGSAKEEIPVMYSRVMRRASSVSPSAGSVCIAIPRHLAPSVETLGREQILPRTSTYFSSARVCHMVSLDCKGAWEMEFCNRQAKNKKFVMELHSKLSDVCRKPKGVFLVWADSSSEHRANQMLQF